MKSFLVLSIVFLLQSCAVTGINSDTGISLISVQTEAGNATSNDGDSKEGRACTKNLLGLFSWGDSSIATAKQQGQISKVSSVDKDYTNILFVWGSVCTVVKGS